MRNLPTAFVEAMNSEVVYLAYFVELGFWEGPVRFWTGLGSTTFEGETFFGVGSLGDIQPFTQTKQLSATGLQLSMSGVSGALISDALSTRGKGRGRPFKLWIGLMEDDFSAVYSNMDGEASYLIAGGKIDEMNIEDEGATSRIIINVEHDIVTLFRASHARYTHGDQQRVFPGDLFFEYTSSLAGKNIEWGVESKLSAVSSSDIRRGGAGGSVNTAEP